VTIVLCECEREAWTVDVPEREDGDITIRAGLKVEVNVEVNVDVNVVAHRIHTRNRPKLDETDSGLADVGGVLDIA